MIGVCIATYNQEAFIAQAIESALMQICNEPLRVYIGDDASTDGTEDICRKYAAKDERIVYVRREKYRGLVDNTIDLYLRMMADGCTYIAMLDGDDYWTDQHKLQMQVDYLSCHPEVGLVHTAAYEERNGKRLEIDNPDKPTGDLSHRYDLHGAWQTNCTVVFRTALLTKEALDTIREQHFWVLDYPLYGLFSQQTRIEYIHHYTASWRIHESVSHTTSIKRFLRYQYHYARAWRWLDKKYPGHFHFRWYKALGWYSWQVFYALVHFCKVYFAKK